jgi:hypothetical protein
MSTPAELCDHYTEDELKHIPHSTKNVMAALDFLSKDDQGFFCDVRAG